MTPVSIRKARATDVWDAFTQMSEQTKAELDNAGVDLVERYAAAERKIEEGDAWVSETDGHLLTLFGFNDYGDHLSMWTVATTRFFDLGAAGVRETRRFFRQMEPEKPLFVVTSSPHPEVGRWLQLLGFRHVADEGVNRVFRRA